MDKVEAAVLDHMNARKEVSHFSTNLEEQQGKAQTAEEDIAVAQVELETQTNQAAEYCAWIETDRTPEEVQLQLNATKNNLKRQAETDGASVEEMVVEVNKKKDSLETAKRELKSMISLNKALKKSIETRHKKWHQFRRCIALRCKLDFSFHLSNRGYFGKVLFDHDNGTLQLKVQTDDQQGTQGGGNREKDPRSLSGGEKSFSTICLLLSLWESIGCPLRCLDEFDVFMDAVNRRISMKMMIDSAEASDRKQYILITPQDMTNINIGSSVRVHRMSDPERGQGTLAFQ